MKTEGCIPGKPKWTKMFDTLQQLSAEEKL